MSLIAAGFATDPERRKGQKKKALPVGEPTDRISFNQEKKQGNDDSSGESGSRENLCSDEGAFSQEYFVYYKKKDEIRAQRIRDAPKAVGSEFPP